MDPKKNSKLDLLFADSIMTENVHVMKQDMLIGQVAHLMLRERVSGYPVVDEKENVIGVVTMTDLFELMDEMFKKDNNLDAHSLSWQQKIAAVKDKPITSIMSKQVTCVSPETPVSKIIEAVVEQHIHTFPVLKDGKLVGIVGRRDVLNAVFVYG